MTMNQASYGFAETVPGARLEKQLGDETLVIRRLEKASEIEPFIKLLNRIWGFSAAESIPVHEGVAVAKTGGLLLSIELGGEPAGVLYAMAAWSPEWGFHHHSNFMGFPPEYRGMGLGFEAKRAHAALAPAMGAKLAAWTFDPLQQLNGGFNFRKLGARCSNYIEDLYGAMGGQFDSGLPTDRLLVEWRLDDPRVVGRLSGRIPSWDELAESHGEAPRVENEAAARDLPDNMDAVLVPVPSGPRETAKSGPAARAALGEFGRTMKALFSAGFEIVEMIRSGVLDGSAYYVLSRERMS